MIGRAIVIGGGIGGLLAAHALAPRADRVTVIERARYPAPPPAGPPPPRRGAPQSHCLHMLMGAGAAAFDALVPGWREALVDRGVVPFDALADSATRFPAGWLARVPSGITMYACSRALLEAVLVERLAALPGVDISQGRVVQGLVADAAGERITGVRVGGGQAIAADLVVDASGTGSRLARWLDGLAEGGGPPVAETVVDSPWHYVSRWVRLAADAAPDWHALSIAPHPGGDGRAAVMLRAENGFWNVVLLAGEGARLPADDAAFRDFAATLGEGRLAAALAAAEPASPIHVYGRTASRMRHWDRRRRWPSGLAVLGDSAMTLDPYFGLGMTASARAAVLLARRLDAPGGFDGQGFQRALAAENAGPWRLVTGHTPDGRPIDGARAGLARLYDAAPSHPEIARAIVEAQHLLRPVESLTKDLAA